MKTWGVWGVVAIIMLAGCGGAANEADPAVIAQAVSATLAALPIPTPVMVEVTRVVEVELASTPMPLPTPLPIPDETPVPTLNQLIPPRWPYLHSYEIKEEYDRFKGHTMVSLEPDLDEMDSLTQGSLWVAYSYDGETPHSPSFVGFSLWSVNEDWEYLNCHSLDLLIDGSPLSLDTEHEGDVMSGGLVSETVIGQLGTRDFLTLVNAGLVEGKLCNTEFKLSREQMQALKDVASRMGTNTIESLSPTQPPPLYDLALVRIDSQSTEDGFTITGAFHNLGDNPTPQLVGLVTFTDRDSNAVVKQQVTLGPLASDVTETFSVVNSIAGNWSYTIELTTVDGESLRYRDFTE